MFPEWSGNKEPKFRMVRSEHAALQKILISKIKGKDNADFLYWKIFDNFFSSVAFL